MIPKTRHLRNTPQHSTISVERLFAAAFKKPGFVYQRESLLGWRPVSIDATPQDTGGGHVPFAEKPPAFTNSPDVKVRENKASIIVEVTLPNINEDSLYLEVSEDLLIIRAEKADTDHGEADLRDKGNKPLIHRYIKLPIIAKPGNVEARLKGNVVVVKIDKPLSGFRNNR